MCLEIVRTLTLIITWRVKVNLGLFTPKMESGTQLSEIDTFQSIWVMNLCNPTSKRGKFIDFISHRYFYPKVDRVGMKIEMLKSD